MPVVTKPMTKNMLKFGLFDLDFRCNLKAQGLLFVVGLKKKEETLV